MTEAGPSDVRIRPAESCEAETLTTIALRAKASWGYDEAFMQACRTELTVSAEAISKGEFFCAEAGSATLGYASVRQDADALWLDDLFVDPNFHGRGAGTALLQHAQREAKARRLTKIKLHADPHAEAIYGKWGFETVGRALSGSIEGRWLPVMERSV